MKAFKALLSREVRKTDPLRVWRGRFFLELFSGSGRLSQAIARTGVPAVRVDIKDNPLFDMTSRPFREYIANLVRSNRALCVCGLGRRVALGPLRVEAAPASRAALFARCSI